MPLGYEVIGSGPLNVIILNDWMGDTCSWQPALPYLDRGRFTWVLADLRGYGRSKEQSGDYNLIEAANDVIALASSLGWYRFSIVGHSMSSLVALHLAQHLPARVIRAVALTPPPPTGPGPGPAVVDMLVAVARGDDAMRLNGLRASWGDRLSEGWIRFKAARWRDCANPEAVAGYVTMFARDGLPDPSTKIAIPLLAVTGERDADHMRRDAVTKFLSPLADRLEIVPILESGHYPMQETPPLLVSIVERFLGGDVATDPA